MADELNDTIEDLASKPKAVETDGLKVQERDLSEVVDAQRHLDGQSAVNKGHRGLRFTKLVPPGAV